jgi:ribosomal silencing factor RsfS
MSLNIYVFDIEEQSKISKMMIIQHPLQEKRCTKIEEEEKREKILQKKRIFPPPSDFHLQ